MNASSKHVLAALSAIGLGIGLMAGAAQATVIYQSVPDLGAPTNYNWCSDCGAGQMVAQQFTLASGATIIGALFTVGSGGWPMPVTLSIYADAGNSTLGAQLFSQTFSSFALETPTGHYTEIVGVNLPSVTLAAGTYELFLVNPGNMSFPGLISPGARTQIVVSNSFGTAPAVGTPYRPLDTDGGLILQTTPVPEPATWLMLTAGVIGLGLLRRRPSA